MNPIREAADRRPQPAVAPAQGRPAQPHPLPGDSRIVEAANSRLTQNPPPSSFPTVVRANGDPALRAPVIIPGKLVHTPMRNLPPPPFPNVVRANPDPVLGGMRPPSSEILRGASNITEAAERRR